MYEVTPSVMVEMTVAKRHEPVRTDGGVAERALVLEKAAVHVFGPGVYTGKAYPAGIGNAQEHQVTAVFTVVLGFY